MVDDLTMNTNKKAYWPFLSNLQKSWHAFSQKNEEKQISGINLCLSFCVNVYDTGELRPLVDAKSATSITTSRK